MVYWKHGLPYLIFIVFIILYGNKYYGQLAPTDAVAYVSIAEKYASNHFYTAINAYWSPMFCWLIATQLKLGTSVDTSISFIKILSGVSTIFLSEKVVNTYRWPVWVQLMCLSLIAVWSSLFTLQFATPDFLMTSELLLYLYILLKCKWLKYPLLTGLLGAILYFTKAFGFYFFPAFFCFFLGWKFFSERNNFQFLLKRSGIVLSSFLFCILPWLAIIHYRYKKWMISSAGSYNHNLMRYGDGSVQPALRSGLLPLPNASAHNPWEEITLVYPSSDWNPFHSVDFLLMQIKIVIGNLGFVLRYLYSIHVLMLPTAAISVLLTGWYITAALRRKNISFRFRTSVYVVSFISLYTLGYCTVGIDYRYLYIVYLGMFFIFFDLLTILQRYFPKATFACYLLAASIILRSLYNISKGLSNSGNELNTQMIEMKVLKNIVPPGSIVATHISNTINAMDYWGKWQNHGGLQAYRNPDDILQVLQQYRVQWVLVPITVQIRYNWLSAFSDTTLATQNWKLYKLKANNYP